MSSKTKHEVNNARTRLDATLQSLVEKKDDSFDSTAESDDEADLPLPVNVEVVRGSGMPVSSPSKRHQTVKSKKRKRKDDGSYAHDIAGSYQHTTYVMKLFDRSVDLAQFDENTPLYPIARAWINSQSNQDATTSKDDENTEDEDDSNDVKKLPPPIRFLKIEYDSDQKDPRIPPLLESTEKPLDIHADPDLGPPPEELLLRHMDRWKKIRNTWISTARINELKYNNSMVVIKDMYEKNLQEQNYDV